MSKWNPPVAPNNGDEYVYDGVTYVARVEEYTCPEKCITSSDDNRRSKEPGCDSFNKPLEPQAAAPGGRVQASGGYFSGTAKAVGKWSMWSQPWVVEPEKDLTNATTVPWTLLDRVYGSRPDPLHPSVVASAVPRFCPSPIGLGDYPNTMRVQQIYDSTFWSLDCFIVDRGTTIRFYKEPNFLGGIEEEITGPVCLLSPYAQSKRESNPGLIQWDMSRGTTSEGESMTELFPNGYEVREWATLDRQQLFAPYLNEDTTNLGIAIIPLNGSFKIRSTDCSDSTESGAPDSSSSRELPVQGARVHFQGASYIWSNTKDWDVSYIGTKYDFCSLPFTPPSYKEDFTWADSWVKLIDKVDGPWKKTHGVGVLEYYKRMLDGHFDPQTRPSNQNILGVGDYPDPYAEDAILYALAGGLCGMAIDKGTTITFYKEKDFKGGVTIEFVGPMILNAAMVKTIIEGRAGMLQAYYNQFFKPWNPDAVLADGTKIGDAFSLDNSLYHLREGYDLNTHTVKPGSMADKTGFHLMLSATDTINNKTNRRKYMRNGVSITTHTALTEGSFKIRKTS